MLQGLNSHCLFLHLKLIDDAVMRHFVVERSDALLLQARLSGENLLRSREII